MTVRELKNMLDEYEDQEAQVVIYTDSEGNDVITEVDLEMFECREDDIEDCLFVDGTLILVPTEFKEDW